MPYYSLIQYIPDFSRKEGTNKGLVIWDNSKIVFCKIIHDSMLSEPLENMKYRIDHLGERTLTEFEYFIRSRGNNIQLTLPRFCKETDYDQMFIELVL